MSETTETKEFTPKTEEMTREEYLLAEHKVQTGVSDTLPGGAKVADVQKSLSDLQNQQHADLLKRDEDKRAKKTEGEPVTAKDAFFNEKLGVTVAENGAVIATPAVEKTDQPASGADQEPENDLPADLPGRKSLLAAGVHTLEKLATLDFDALTAIPGIKDATAEKILSYGKS